MPDDAPTTQQLRAIQRDREATERESGKEAPTEEVERTHERRADKAAYLEEKLAEAQRSEEES